MCMLSPHIWVFAGYFCGTESAELFSICFIFAIWDFSARTNFLPEMKRHYITCNMWQICETFIKILPGSRGKLKGKKPHHKTPTIHSYPTIPCYLENFRVEIKSSFSNRKKSNCISDSEFLHLSFIEQFCSMSDSLIFYRSESKHQFLLYIYIGSNLFSNGKNTVSFFSKLNLQLELRSLQESL